MASDEEILLGLRKLRWQMFSREFKRELRYHVAFATWWAIEQANAREFVRQYMEVIQQQQMQRKLEPEVAVGSDGFMASGSEPLRFKHLDESDPPLTMEQFDGQRPSPCGSDTACSGAAAAGDS